MPELPEVETVCRGLAAVLEGRRFAEVQLRRPDLRIPFPKGLATSLAGRRVEKVRRRAKYIVMDLDDGRAAVAHLGMSGRMVISAADAAPGLHDHVVFTTDAGVRVFFNDPRRFGLLTLAESDKLDGHKLFKHLGPDPLTDEFTPEVLSAVLKGRATSIKLALLDQRIVVGVGNIYASESLHRAGISPKRKAGTVAGVRAETLVPVIKDVLMEAIAAGGSTLRDHMQPSGELGYFQHRFRVYDRAGEPCTRDNRGRITRIVQGGRSTFFCPACQK